MAFAGIAVGAVGLIFLLWVPFLSMLLGLGGAILSAKQIQAAQEDGDSPGLAYLGVAVSMASLLIGAAMRFFTGCF